MIHLSSSANNDTITYDYLFIGLGAANSLLLLQLHKQRLLTDKKIAILEPNFSGLINKTFCFWGEEEELAELGIMHLANISWSRIKVNNGDATTITPLKYVHIAGSSLYEHTKKLLEQLSVGIITKNFIEYIPAASESIISLRARDTILNTKKVFDSRPPQFIITNQNQRNLTQSFIGWKIETTNKDIDPSTMVLMDFEVDQRDTCQFVYVLPFSKHQALVEVTRFGTTNIEEKEASQLLDDYLKRKDISYKVTEIEKGFIPMSSANIKNDVDIKNWIHTGTAAGMLKPSTGYAFKAMAKDALQLVTAIKEEQEYTRKTTKTRFSFYDRLLLKILAEKPHKGKIIFDALFSKVPIQRVLYFLNEKTNLVQEAGIFSKLPIGLFLLAAIKDLGYQIINLSPTILALCFTIISLLLISLGYTTLVWGLLGILFITYGLSHGAVDHLADKKIKHTKSLIIFISGYLLKAILLGILWWIAPILSLIAFILFSAWHFGQADFTEWRISNNGHAFIWGLSVLSMILLLHFNETIFILQQIPGLSLITTQLSFSTKALMYSQIAIVGVSLLLAYTYRCWGIIITISYLLLSYNFPIMISFGIYFCLQHSLHGWKFLQKSLALNSRALLVKASPYTSFAIIFFILAMWLYQDKYLGLFFIVLSCISMPHIFSMHTLYKKSLVKKI